MLKLRRERVPAHFRFVLMFVLHPVLLYTVRIPTVGR